MLVALQGKPALLRLPGADHQRPLRLVACLLHGNEDSGFRAVCDLLRAQPALPYDLWVFIGNVRAASQEGWFAHRFLDDQEDFNRVWGLEPQTTRMRRCAAAVLEEVLAEPLEAAIDLHNNTGQNPRYAIMPETTLETLRAGRHGRRAGAGLGWWPAPHAHGRAARAPRWHWRPGCPRCPRAAAGPGSSSGGSSRRPASISGDRCAGRASSTRCASRSPCGRRCRSRSAGR